MSISPGQITLCPPSPFAAADLTFKCGTSLSKAYKIIDRFSENIDLTFDIRKLIADLVSDGSGLPASRSQADKWTKAVRKRLSDWITTNVQPVIEAALAYDGLDAQIEIGGLENARGANHVSCDRLMSEHLARLTRRTGIPRKQTAAPYLLIPNLSVTLAEMASRNGRPTRSGCSC